MVESFPGGKQIIVVREEEPIVTTLFRILWKGACRKGADILHTIII